MGGNESATRPKRKEYDDAVKCFDPGELEQWKRCFHELSQTAAATAKRPGLDERRLIEYTKPILPEMLQKQLASIFSYVNSQIVGGGDSKKGHVKNSVDWESFIVAIAYILKAGLDEKTRMFSLLCGSSDGHVVTKAQLAETVAALIRAYVSAESRSPEFVTWLHQFPQEANQSSEWSTALVSYFLRDIRFDGDGTVSSDALVRWMGSQTVLTKLIDFVIYVAFRFNVNRDDEMCFIPWTIPTCEPLESANFKTVLTAPTLLLLSYHIPLEYRRQWRLLYTTAFHGESFSTLLRQITGKGATILVITDENGFIFGGFNSSSWELGSCFHGNESCFLFSLFPTVAVYSPTGYNKNYCYSNVNQQTLPNGLGFGGQLNDQPMHYFSLWLDSDFGRGSSQGSCTTYNCPQLSSNKCFKVRSLEVWAVEKTSDASKGKTAKSILDVDPEARAILEMTGKTRASEGLREPNIDDED